MATSDHQKSRQLLLDQGEALEGAPPERILAWAEERFGALAAIAASFGAEDVALIDLARKHAPSLQIFTLDTGRLPPETYEVMEVIRSRYGISVQTFFPEREAVEELETSKGLFSFRESLADRKACCAIRKVEPLKRALTGRAAWLSGMRREQSITRSEVRVIEFDEGHGLIKLNPLASWSSADTWSYIHKHGLPYNRLHDQGFPSVGCAPCTRAIKPWEGERAGRWWWESDQHRECGLHTGGR